VNGLDGVDEGTTTWQLSIFMAVPRALPLDSGGVPAPLSSPASSENGHCRDAVADGAEQKAGEPAA
jgi:hypothetical protein